MVQTEYICFTNQPALAANQLQMHCPRITLINFQRFTLYIKWKCLSGWIFLSTFPYLHHLSVNFPVKWCNFSFTLQAGADPSWARRKLGGELLQPAQLLLHGPEHDRQLVRGRAMHFQGENSFIYPKSQGLLTVFFWSIYPYLDEWVLKNICNERWMPEQSAPDWPSTLDLSGAANVEDNGTRRKNFVSALVSGAIIYPGLVLWLDLDSTVCFCTFYYRYCV